MSSTVFDSALFRDMFGTAEMRAVFSDKSLIERYIEVEVALARAEARCGVIPADAAEQIAALATYESLDLTLMQHETEIVGYPILPLVEQLSKTCGEAGRYVHWGATTQDIMDTAVVLQVRAALAIVERDIQAVRGLLADLALRYRTTPMAGRTHLQHALPITFGYKCAVWLSMFDRHAERLVELRPRVEIGQFAGAAGTLASLGDKGLEVQEALMSELQLGVPQATWHVARDGLAETLNFLGLVTGSLGKVALDVMMMTSELGEVYEPFVKGRGASSTMPQKRNPISCELMYAAAKGVRQHAGLMLDAMIQDFERSTGPWQAEWIAIPEAFALSAASLGQAKFMLAGLEVRTERMRQNLDMTQGLIVAEAVMMGLAPALGRQVAHDVVYAACRMANDQRISLLDALLAQGEATAQLDIEELKRLTDPANYLGLAPQMVDIALARPGAIKR
ncbi:class-II fumarase/aspartase family protein [Pseudomonas syringae]|uniref:class-II fumarase/aspartase family protein n=1 Tax=Pseudomonas syringae TaxID=317 RepID=UPI000309609E|nr:adenylosuccinate lyase family protein [Pseudomonas syringae]AQL37238.1 3-carboxy-cis,cis-muconate cycloisomerase [Pseudomonas syringae pv. actinidiae ICMP 9853]EPM87795.1 3-carboxy-cis,cis-muconate cycloisomerase [Pseudomonas syringae pv. actinidiae ICMP 19068]EPM96561.1 3-carboxy-cis,cis-muconate cycloisomerase [Pseudomonas syringae pv. actinidiae ICMP 19104]EPN10739.1 3-carboxy-cis,cis-muconate cycloisomerase [Pseudomonas syringae pv. actinidiae ICMP 9855]KCU97969.1 3-carboxy-cis,cis-muco